MLAESYTAVIARGEDWTDGSATEPYEASWAREAAISLRRLEAAPSSGAASARVQVSLDGLHWVDEGTVVAIPSEVDTVTLARITGFPGYLRLVADMADGDTAFMLATLSLKG
ncbi:hypothetical protein [Cucumibacter marinus]|uniref:hypothetical protein n=1 Tax=Cucumibacter marinus TaxID=1121252 RepID=UPI00048B910D|nr:hypothetical protein [Cucumibacter marinus]